MSIGAIEELNYSPVPSDTLTAHSGIAQGHVKSYLQILRSSLGALDLVGRKL
jgi:hypothetical protein